MPTPDVQRGKFRRRPPTSKAERERRKSWGAVWSQVGKDWKRQQLNGAE